MCEPLSSRQTVAELAELAGGLAHELRNPLSTMMLNLKLLAEDLQDETVESETMRRRAMVKVDTLTGAASRLQTLFDDFLTVTGPYRLDRKRIDLNTTFDRLVAFAEPLARSQGVDIRVEKSREPIMVEVDEALLSQALLNLIINAQDAMPDGGTLTLSARTDGRSRIISVADTGIGISPNDRDRIFRPFHSTKADGSGLGLSISQRIVQEHNGTLTCTSEPGRGSTFTISLPRYDQGNPPCAS